jgi:hypothetical protein
MGWDSRCYRRVYLEVGPEMSAITLANSYRDAQELVIAARVEMHRVDAIWQKLNRVTKYLDAQAAAEFAEVLS